MAKYIITAAAPKRLGDHQNTGVGTEIELSQGFGEAFVSMHWLIDPEAEARTKAAAGAAQAETDAKAAAEAEAQAQAEEAAVLRRRGSQPNRPPRGQRKMQKRRPKRRPAAHPVTMPPRTPKIRPLAATSLPAAVRAARNRRAALRRKNRGSRPWRLCRPIRLSA